MKMTPVEAVNYLRELRREEPDVRLALTRICARLGHRDIYDWAQAEEGQVVEFAEQMNDAFGQFLEFDRRARNEEREVYRRDRQND